MKKFLEPPPSAPKTPERSLERKLPSWAKVAKPDTYQPPSPETYIPVELDIDWPSL